MLTAPTSILTIPEAQAERLFSGPDAVDAEFKALAKRWHPDRGGDAKVFAHINVLHKVAAARAKDGTWRVPGRLDLKGADGKEYRVRYVRDFDVGLGRGYIGRGIVAYTFAKDVVDLAQGAELALGGFRFPAKSADLTEKLRKEFTPRVPKVKASIRLADGGMALVLEKPEDAVRLRDLLDHYGGWMDPRHVAWITSELLNICCWLTQEGLTHNDISLDSVFVRPALHHVFLPGGWWYASTAKQRMKRLQAARTVRFLPPEVTKTKQAHHITDLSQVRLLGRELLGDETGMSLVTDKRVPDYLANWLRMAASGVAKRDFKEWQDILANSFGGRRFTKMETTFSDIYKET